MIRFVMFFTYSKTCSRAWKREIYFCIQLRYLTSFDENGMFP